MSKKIFRETALERLSSPEQLDKMIRVTSPRGWMSLSALCAVVAAVIAWAFFGRIPTTEISKGILVPGGGNPQVVAPSAGRLKSLLVTVGDLVQEGQVVGEIDRKDLEEQLRQGIQTLRDLQERQAKLDAADKVQKDLEESLAHDERGRLDELLESLQQRINRLTDRRDSAEKLREQGVVNKIEVDAINEEIDSTRASMYSARLQIVQLTTKTRTDEAQRVRDSINRQMEIEKVAHANEFLQGSIELYGKIVSRSAGVVVEVRGAVNTAVAAGDPILLLETGGTGKAGGRNELKAVLYVAAGAVNKITKGMEVKLLPSTVKREEHGSMYGSVVSVSSVPTSRGAMVARLNDPNLVDQLIRDIGLPRELEISLTPDTLTPSGYKWTSGRGPPVNISSGTLCTGWVTINEQPPIAFVIPLFKGES